MRLLLATANEHKRRELAALLRPHELDLLPGDVVLPPETGTTFEANALIKARAAAEQTGRVTIADDSGIEAEALGGAPGVLSARYAGPDATDKENLDKLFAAVPTGSPLAYVCVLVFVDPGRGIEKSFEGRCTGRAAPALAGENGFGYDPMFVPDDYEDDRTMAELDPAEKDAISHRGRAARALHAWLREHDGG